MCHHLLELAALYPVNGRQCDGDGIIRVKLSLLGSRHKRAIKSGAQHSYTL